jgi:hypothetical protein
VLHRRHIPDQGTTSFRIVSTVFLIKEIVRPEDLFYLILAKLDIQTINRRNRDPNLERS